MKFILEINNKTAYKFPKTKFMGVFKRTLNLADFECLKNNILELSIAMVNEEEIQILNKQYRKKNSPTDVLSFCEHASSEEICRESKSVDGRQPLFLGELILCPTYIQHNADEDEQTFEYALTYITAHGILHLLGLEHGKKMFSMQQLVADQLVVL